MAQYANQKTIVIHRDDAITSGHPYVSLTLDDVAEASRNLSGIGFKLYIYLASNKDGFERDYSPKHFASIYGVSVDSARRIPNELIEQGYLVQKGSKYHFYDKPHLGEDSEEAKADLLEIKREDFIKYEAQKLHDAGCDNFTIIKQLETLYHITPHEFFEATINRKKTEPQQSQQTAVNPFSDLGF